MRPLLANECGLCGGDQRPLRGDRCDLCTAAFGTGQPTPRLIVRRVRAQLPPLASSLRSA